MLKKMKIKARPKYDQAVERHRLPARGWLKPSILDRACKVHKKARLYSHKWTDITTDCGLSRSEAVAVRETLRNVAEGRQLI